MPCWSQIERSLFRCTVDLEAIGVRKKLRIPNPVPLILLDVVAEGFYDGGTRPFALPIPLRVVDDGKVGLSFWHGANNAK